MANPEAVARILDAAERTPTTNLRESAIIGAIVRSLIDTGHFKPKFVQHAAGEFLRRFIKDISVTEPGVFLGKVTEAEIRHAIAAFMAQYNPPPAASAAA